MFIVGCLYMVDQPSLIFAGKVGALGRLLDLNARCYSNEILILFFYLQVRLRYKQHLLETSRG
jgi:hypothetical protein